MSAESPESLRADLEVLRSQLAPVLARDRARVEGEGRPFDALGWVQGRPDSHKFPGGPAFLVSRGIDLEVGRTDVEGASLAPPEALVARPGPGSDALGKGMAPALSPLLQTL